MTKDYYKILGISEFSSQDEIKSAYRKLARKWHPDVAGNTFDVINRFKEINEAYEILSEASKKADYDTARKFYNYAKQTKTKTSKFETNKTTQKNTTRPDFHEEKVKNNFSFNWEELIFGKNKDSQQKYASQKGSDINTDIEISVIESIEGCTKVINMLQTQICPKCGGRKFINGGSCGYCKGKGETSVHKRFSVKIPAGIKDKSKIRLAGEGEKGKNGGQNGDLYIKVNIKSPKDYQTDGLNILKTIQIAPYEAVLGTTITVSAITGNFSVKISPNTKSGQKIKLNNCGIQSGTRTGDMILTIEIQIPKNITEEEVLLYKRLKELSSESVRNI